MRYPRTLPSYAIRLLSVCLHGDAVLSLCPLPLLLQRLNASLVSPRERPFYYRFVSLFILTLARMYRRYLRPEF